MPSLIARDKSLSERSYMELAICVLHCPSLSYLT